MIQSNSIDGISDAAKDGKSADAGEGAFVKEIAAILGKKPSKRGIELAMMLSDFESRGTPIKIKKSSYIYKNKNYKRLNFGYDLRLFLRRHDLKIIDFACTLGRSYWTVHNWFETDARVPVDAEVVIDVMRRIDAITGNYPE